ncbi:LysR family transcriptional regulator [Dactylosporangium sp. CS-033363]|uniref:LysR family transcriptional regulator n=1 Tax=Dactylosporangium sp. CS-033363 TaxID=3239935 RepID=UPI003D8D8364
MGFGDVSLVGLRVFREIAARGTLTGAAAALGYTQSGVSRQIAALERATGARLLDRRPDGVRLTAAGRIVLRRAATMLDEADAATRDLAGLTARGGTVRLGWFPSAGAVIVPRALARLDGTITVLSREGSTAALVRALRAGTLDLALLAAAPPFRPPDAEDPPLEIEVLAERELLVALPLGHALAAGDHVDVSDLRGVRWIDGPLMGVWPGLGGRPVVAHTARDWLAKLRLVAAGLGVTTVPASLAPAVPEGVRLLPVRGGPRELRRLTLARRPGPVTEAAVRLIEALRAVAL